MAAARVRLPPPPKAGAAFRTAAEDLFYNSWRFVAANVIFGVGLLAITLLALQGLIFFALAALLGPVMAGMTRMATTLVRDRHTDLGEFFAQLRRPILPLVLATIQVGLVFVLVVDLLAGAGVGGAFGAFLSVSALYGLFLLWLYAVLAWPILLDPVREADPIRRRLRLAVVLLVAYPLRTAGMALVLLLIVAASAVAIMLILTVSVAFVALVAAHYVLPAADRLEGRQLPVEEE